MRAKEELENHFLMMTEELNHYKREYCENDCEENNIEEEKSQRYEHRDSLRME